MTKINISKVFRFSLTSLLIVISIDYAYSLDAAQQREMLAAHNQTRLEVNVPALKWSISLAKSAQVYADKLVSRGGCRLVHSKVIGIGENLYWASPITQTVTSSNGSVRKLIKPQEISALNVVEAWAQEKGSYVYSTNSCNTDKVCGHYTQLVWKSTTNVGCAKAMCEDGAQIWVCHYAPPGNYIGQKPY